MVKDRYQRVIANCVHSEQRLVTSGIRISMEQDIGAEFLQMKNITVSVLTDHLLFY